MSTRRSYDLEDCRAVFDLFYPYLNDLMILFFFASWYPHGPRRVETSPRTIRQFGPIDQDDARALDLYQVYNLS